jgi:hypothetical protein
MINSEAFSPVQLKSKNSLTQCNVLFTEDMGPTDSLPEELWIYCTQYPHQPLPQTPTRPFLKIRMHCLLLLLQTAVNTEININCKLSLQ